MSCKLRSPQRNTSHVIQALFSINPVVVHCVLQALTRGIPPFLWHRCILKESLNASWISWKTTTKEAPICSVNDKTISLPSLYRDLIPNIYASLKLVWYLSCFPAYACISNTQEQLPFVKISFEHRVISLQTSAITTSLELLGAVQ